MAAFSGKGYRTEQIDDTFAVTVEQTARSLKDPGSAITHFIGFACALPAGIPLLLFGYRIGGGKAVLAYSLFILGLVVLYGASTVYHSLNLSERGNRVLRKLDHSMIYVLIAGTYSPICILGLEKKTGIYLLIAIWSMAFIGIIQAMLWINCPKWVSALIYVIMGWACIAVMPELVANLRTTAVIWLLLGGVIYTAGAVIYALKLKVFNEIHRNFGSHEIFHLFCLAGSFCHYMTMFYLL